jgi:hypothetical protein
MRQAWAGAGSTLKSVVAVADAALKSVALGFEAQPSTAAATSATPRNLQVNNFNIGV